MSCRISHISIVLNPAANWNRWARNSKYTGNLSETHTLQRMGENATEIQEPDVVAKLCPTLRLPWCAAHGLLCPSASPDACSDSRPLNWWCYLAIAFSDPSSSSFCLQSYPTSGYFPMSQLLHQVAKVLELSVLPVTIQGWFTLGLTSLILLLSKGFSRVFSNTTIQKHQFFGA